MNVHISYKMAKAPDVEREFSHHIAKLKKRVQVYRPELVHLHGIVDQNSSSRGEMMISLNLRLPSGQLAAQESGPTAVAAMKRAFAELMKQLSKHKDQLRGAHYRRSRKPANGRKEVPFEETLAAVHPAMASGDDVSSYINANLKKLERFINREIRYRSSAGLIEPDQVTREEILDEAVATALGEDEEKPELLSLERWMYRLALQALDRIARDGEPDGTAVPLEVSARKQNVRASDEPELQYHQPDETLTRESVIADRRIATPEEIAYSDEMIALVEQSLRSAGREDREAFILHALEGFTLEEIAMTTDRPQEKVKASVQAAREHLRNALHVPAPVKERLLRAKIA